MSTTKSQVFSVRIEPHLKMAVQRAAELEMRSLANMFEVMVIAYCREREYPLPGVPKEALPNLNARKKST